MSQACVIITKRDGTLEPFHVVKLRACLGRVLPHSGVEARLAQPLAEAVGLHLRQGGAGEFPTSGYIFRCAVSVLRQTGLDEAAEVLEEHRRLRAARRRRVRVYDPSRPERPALRWRKQALVGTLQGVYGLRHGVARFLAGRVEDQALGLGYRLLSKPLVAELVRNEVQAWGLQAPGQVVESRERARARAERDGARCEEE